MKLLDVEQTGPGVFQKTWLHSDGKGNDNFTVETIQDVEPIFADVKKRAENETSKDSRFVASIPAVVMTETSKVCAKHWGTSVRLAFSEIMQNKTDRAHQVWKTLTTGVEYSRLQAKTWR